VPHHGSGYQDPDFLRLAGARVALVSVGAGNDYGHPAARTVDLLSKAGTGVVRTDLGGTLLVAGNRQHLRVITRRAAIASGPRGPPAADGAGASGLNRSCREVVS
jgi:competence protein ComEC